MALLVHIARHERIGNTMGHVIAQDLFFDLMQGRADGIDLRQYIHAIAIVIDHAEQSADLALDTLEACPHAPLGHVVHFYWPLIQYPCEVYRGTLPPCHLFIRNGDTVTAKGYHHDGIRNHSRPTSSSRG